MQEKKKEKKIVSSTWFPSMIIIIIMISYRPFILNSVAARGPFAGPVNMCSIS